MFISEVLDTSKIYEAIEKAEEKLTLWDLLENCVDILGNTDVVVSEGSKFAELVENLITQLRNLSTSFEGEDVSQETAEMLQTIQTKFLWDLEQRCIQLDGGIASLYITLDRHKGGV